MISRLERKKAARILARILAWFFAQTVVGAT